MEEILHQLIWRIVYFFMGFHSYLAVQDFLHPADIQRYVFVVGEKGFPDMIRYEEQWPKNTYIVIRGKYMLLILSTQFYREL